MIVDDLDIPSIVIDPPEADTPLAIDTDAHLPDPIALQDFQLVSGRITEILHRNSSIQLTQFTQRSILNLVWQFPTELALPHPLRLRRLERADHVSPARYLDMQYVSREPALVILFRGLLRPEKSKVAALIGAEYFLGV
jgi:hypothetical protein